MRKKPIKLLALLLFVSALFLCSGCESKLTKKARTGINSVSINWDGKLPKRMRWGSDGGGGYNLLSAAVFTAINTAGLPEKVRKSRAIYALMRENNIDPGRILETQFKEQLETKQVFGSIVETDEDATFTLEIGRYGLMRDSGSASWPPYPLPLKPVLTVTVRLKKPDGTLIWKNWAMTSDRTNEVDAYRYNKYIENPRLLRTGFEQAASKIVSKFLKNIEDE